MSERPSDPTELVATRVDTSITATEIQAVRPPSSTPPKLELQAGAQVADRYRIERLLGRGGFGEVYEATDLQGAGRPVALKLHRLESAAGTAIDALKGEFELLASLSHPNLATVHDFGFITDDVAYLTQSIARGVRLDHAGLRFTSPLLVELLGQLCRALEYLHARGLLHGDLKPSNVIVDLEAEHLTLLDFGVARAMSADPLTRFGGTIAYMAPEVIRAEPTDARADLYSLGVLLHRLATGRVPFRGSSTEVWTAHVLEPPPALPPEIPAEYARIVERLLEKEPAERFASARETLEALCAASQVEIPAETEESMASYIVSARWVGDRSVLEGLGDRAEGARSFDAVLVRGEAGTGKSRLIRELRRRLQLRGRVWIDVDIYRANEPITFFRELASAILTPAVEAQLEPDDRVELARALPRLQRDDRPIAVALDPERAERDRIAALGRAWALRLEGAAGVIAVEDVHWADEGILRIVGELARHARSAGGRGLLVLTGRPTEVTARIEELAHAEVLDVARLEPEASGALVDSMFGGGSVLEGTAFSRALADRAHSALWVQETARWAIEQALVVRSQGRWERAGEIPELGLGDVLARRVEALSRPARELALALAVLGRAAALVDVAAVAGRRIDDIAPGLSELVRKGLVEDRRESQGRVVYTMHDRFVDAVLERTAKAEVRATHTRAAGALAAAGEAEWSALQRAALHSVAAGDASQAAFLYRRAAAKAAVDGRPDAAARLVDSELGLLVEDDPELVAERAIDLYDHARRGGALALGDDAIAVLGRLRPKVSLPCALEIVRRFAEDDLRTGRASRARRRCLAALSVARRLRRRDTECSLLLLTGRIEESWGQVEVAGRSFARAADLAQALGDRSVEANARLGTVLVETHLGREGRARVAAERAVDAAATLGDPALSSEALRHLGTTLRREDLERAADVYRQSIDRARDSGSPELEAKALNNLGTVAQSLGNIAEAVESYRRSILLKQRVGAVASALVGHNNLGALFASLGRYAEARGELGRVLAADGKDVPAIVALAQANLGDLSAVEGDLEGAIRMERSALSTDLERVIGDYGAYASTSLVRLLVMRNAPGDLDQAAELLNRTPTDDLGGSLEARRRVMAARVMLLDVRGLTDDALLESARAIELEDARTDFSGLFGTHLESLWIHALLLKRSGDTAHARTLGRRSAELLDRMAQRAGDEEAAELFRRAHPMHRAIVASDFDLPAGWTWRS